MFVNQPSVAEIYTLSAEKKKLVIQAVAPVDSEKLFPLVLKIATAGNYKFIADVSGSSQKYTYFLEDKLQNVTQDLGQSPEYDFSSGVATDTSGNRFVIHLKTVQTPTQPDQPNNPDQPGQPDNIATTGAEPMIIYSIGQQVIVKNCPVPSNIFIYDLLGRAVHVAKGTTSYETISTNLQNGYYLIKIIDNNKITTRIIPINR
jgi:hypothetical protein